MTIALFIATLKTKGDNKMVSITLPKRIEEKFRQKAEETGALPEELALELIIQSLKEKVDPEDMVEHYQALSEKYLAEAREFLRKGDLVQTSEKLWGATSLTLKMVAAKKGLKLEKHGSLWSFINMLSKESGNKDFVRFFAEANALHRNFYENEMEREAVETIAEDIEKLIAKLRRL